MAQGSQNNVTITSEFVNNSTTASTVSKSVPRVVVNNQLVPDFRQANPGVVISEVGASKSGNTNPLQTSEQFS